MKREMWIGDMDGKNTTSSSLPTDVAAFPPSLVAYLDPFGKLDHLVHILVSPQRRHSGLELDDSHNLIRGVLFDLAILHNGDEALRLAAFDDQPGPDLLSGENWRGSGRVNGDSCRGGDDDHF